MSEKKPDESPAEVVECLEDSVIGGINRWAGLRTRQYRAERIRLF